MNEWMDEWMDMLCSDGGRERERDMIDGNMARLGRGVD